MSKKDCYTFVVAVVIVLAGLFLYILPIWAVCNVINDAKTEIIIELQKPRKVVIVYPEEPSEDTLEIEVNE